MKETGGLPSTDRLSNPRPNAVRPVLPKLLAISVGTLIGAALGPFSAGFVWEWIYGIGSSVVSDALYMELQGRVIHSGLFVGAASGFLLAALLRESEWAWGIFVAQFLSVVVGSLLGAGGWRMGLIGYHSTHGAAVLIAASAAVARVIRAAPARRFA